MEQAVGVLVAAVIGVHEGIILSGEIYRSYTPEWQKVFDDEYARHVRANKAV